MVQWRDGFYGGWWWWCGKEEVVAGTEMVGVVVTTCSGVVEPWRDGGCGCWQRCGS